MNCIKVKSSAKINLSLDVTGKLPDGYHTIESVFQTVGIYDITETEISEGNDISLECSDSDIPCNERNIAYRAVLLFKELCGFDFGCKIKIEKNIPSQAGMGGGSSDGACIFYSLNKLLNTGFTIDDMLPYAEKLGADVPFFLMGGTAYVQGKGEKLHPLNDFSGNIMLIAKGSAGISTPEAYRNIDKLENPVHPDTQKLLKCINSGDKNAFRYYGNIFEQAVKNDDIDTIKSVMMNNNALCSVMTGSGSAVFGQFSDMDSASKCRNILKDRGFYAEVCKTEKNSFIDI